ncbi:siderophore-interacting protein [Emticicia sp. TH156]|uniref:siderophore-interacting protein n=1 Tax=Emticicia sp. TH156 TaxID=2067454 RepID=UPI000C75924B|nr:siderophore-interacting protein [Emticicia sp. TH156]PLK42622.1 siderophore-interacting protein [Emticicia sp. TH156]
MANILAKAVSNLMDQLLSPSIVVGIRVWKPETLYEIDLHLPTTDFNKWNTIKRVKCKVDNLEYRDYTPALWNADKKICTLFVEAGHNGAGSRWAQNLKTGDEVLLGVAHAAQLPATDGKILCLADGSALGHCLSLKQLTNRESYPLDVAVVLDHNYQIPSSLVNDNPDFEFIANPQGDATDVLEKWYLSKDLSCYASIYIAGYIPMVTGLRKRLKAISGIKAKIFAYGFWS